jgi:hypothetical protein
MTVELDHIIIPVNPSPSVVAEWLDEAIAIRFAASAGTYGSPRIARDLDGWRVSVHTVAARMNNIWCQT